MIPRRSPLQMVPSPPRAMTQQYNPSLLLLLLALLHKHLLAHLLLQVALCCAACCLQPLAQACGTELPPTQQLQQQQPGGCLLQL